MHVTHIVFRFDYGGLENGVVNVITGLQEESMRHSVIALTQATEFAARLPDGVDVHSLGKKPGKDFGSYFRLFKLLRKLRPDIVHTRNMGTMDCALVAFLARVPVRIHGEHGWDVFDPDGTNPKYRLIRRILHCFVQRIVTVSDDLKQWLVSVVQIPPGKVQQICNGVDVKRFAPTASDGTNSADDAIVIGSVTRFSAIKDPMNLVEAFIQLQDRDVCQGMTCRLVMLGDGELHAKAVARLEAAGLSEFVSLPGSRDDVADALRRMDIFVLGSLREGISNTVLEAMATGLPVIASDTGGNRELIVNGETGALVPPGDRAALAAAIAEYLIDTKRRRQHGAESRERAVSQYSIQTMVDNYRALYDSAYCQRSS
ncbi:MAG: TIGR03088 family PEP-CTERM/XrtA system glycosyltransferase [Pseudomonadota bacterium]